MPNTSSSGKILGLVCAVSIAASLLNLSNSASAQTLRNQYWPETEITDRTCKIPNNVNNMVIFPERIRESRMTAGRVGLGSATRDFGLRSQVPHQRNYLRGENAVICVDGVDRSEDFWSYSDTRRTVLLNNFKTGTTWTSCVGTLDRTLEWYSQLYCKTWNNTPRPSSF